MKAQWYRVEIKVSVEYLFKYYFILIFKKDSMIMRAIFKGTLEVYKVVCVSL